MELTGGEAVREEGKKGVCKIVPATLDPVCQCTASTWRGQTCERATRGGDAGVSEHRKPLCLLRLYTESCG